MHTSPVRLLAALVTSLLALGLASGIAGATGSVDSRHSGGDVSQSLWQDSYTKQYARSSATSWQFVPLNINGPTAFLSKDANYGDVRQTNDASATSEAENTAITKQSA